LLNDQPIPIHGDGNNIREWIDVRDHCSALMTILKEGQPGEIYNIGSGLELSNMEMVGHIAQKLNKIPEIKWIPDRKGHDFRYSIDCTKIKKLGWNIQYALDQTLDYMIKWYMAHQERYA
jgi:dTDP-glucose 4,6-dehydratase